MAIAAVVKGDGYGHGLEAAARTFAAAGAELLCVATLDEGLALRAAGVTAPTAVLFAIPVERLDEAIRARLELVAADLDGIDALLRAWRARSSGLGHENEELVLHLEIETGLGRAGVPVARAAAVAASIVATPGVRLRSVWSHLASSHDADTSAEQVGRFETAVAAVRRAGVEVPARHLAASGGLFGATGPSLELVRPGLALYGELGVGFPVAPSLQAAASALRPALTLKARPLRVEAVPAGTPTGYGGLWRAPRPSVVATLPVGYADGYARSYGAGSGADGTADVLVRGRRASVVGSVAMDAIAVDVTNIPGVGQTDEFVLLGVQGNDRIAASELARLRTTIVYEVLTAMAPRLTRVYHAPAGLLGLRTLQGETASRERGGEA